MKSLKDIYKKLATLDHPFPNKEIILMQKLYKEKLLNKEDIEIISELLQKYLSLRADVFYED